MSLSAQTAGNDPRLTESEGQQLFVREVYPLLQQKCFGCHGDDKQGIEGDLDLTSREGFLKGGESGEPAIIPGKPEKSLCFRAVQRTGKMKMPPKDRNALSSEEIEVLRRWIKVRAPWSEAVAATNTTKWNYKAEDIWAFQPVKKVAVPEVINGKIKTANPIDAFIQQKLRALNLEPVPPADKATLIRRVTLDLTGLLPDPKDVKAFVDDDRPDAF